MTDPTPSLINEMIPCDLAVGSYTLWRQRGNVLHGLRCLVTITL